jgi:tetratricopeptide (TPR) repeat protein
VGFERFEKTQQLENAGAALKGAKARENQEAVQAGYSEARERFRTVVAADPNLKEAWNLIGYTSRRLGDYEESLSAYDKALALAPDYPEAIEYRAELFLLTGRLAQAKEAYAALTKSSPSYAGVLKTSMQAWVADKKAASGVAEAERTAFATWVATL